MYLQEPEVFYVMLPHHAPSRALGESVLPQDSLVLTSAEAGLTGRIGRRYELVAKQILEKVTPESHKRLSQAVPLPSEGQTLKSGLSVGHMDLAMWSQMLKETSEVSRPCPQLYATHEHQHCVTQGYRTRLSTVCGPVYHHCPLKPFPPRLPEASAEMPMLHSGRALVAS